MTIVALSSNQEERAAVRVSITMPRVRVVQLVTLHFEDIAYPS